MTTVEGRAGTPVSVITCALLTAPCRAVVRAPGDVAGVTGMLCLSPGPQPAHTHMHTHTQPRGPESRADPFLRSPGPGSELHFCAYVAGPSSLSRALSGWCPGEEPCWVETRLSASVLGTLRWPQPHSQARGRRRSRSSISESEGALAHVKK